jgi:hypothetical protein
MLPGTLTGGPHTDILTKIQGTTANAKFEFSFLYVYAYNKNKP